MMTIQMIYRIFRYYSLNDEFTNETTPFEKQVRILYNAVQELGQLSE